MSAKQIFTIVVVCASAVGGLYFAFFAVAVLSEIVNPGNNPLMSLGVN